MRCDRFLTALATGGPLRRWRARRHAVRCPRCAAEWTWYREVVEGLGREEPLSPTQHATWLAASRSILPFVPRRRLVAGLAAAAAVLVLGLVALRVGTRHPAAVEHPALVRDIPSSPPRATPPEFDAMQDGLRALSKELALLDRQAALLDERRDVEALWSRTASHQP